MATQSDTHQRRCIDRARQRRRVHLTFRDGRLGAQERDGVRAVDAAIRRATNLNWVVTREESERNGVVRIHPPEIRQAIDDMDAGLEPGYQWMAIWVPIEDARAAAGAPRPLIDLPAPWE